MIGRYKARHRSRELLERVRVILSGALSGALSVVAFVGGVLVVLTISSFAVAVAWLVGEAWWSVNPLYGILWGSALALVVPTVGLGRWKSL